MKFGLCYAPGADFAPDAVLLGAFPLLSQTERSRIASAIRPDRIQEVPSLSSDPLGYLFAANPVCNRHELEARLLACGLSERLAVLESARWSQFHLHLARTHLEMLSATCLANGVNGIDAVGDDEALAYRLKQQTYYLRLPPDDSICELTFGTDRERIDWWQARAKAELEKISSFRLYSNWQKPEIRRRPRPEGDVDELAVKLRLHTLPAERRKTLVWVKTMESSEAAALREARAACEAQSCRAGAPRRMPARAFSGMPPHNGLSAARLEKMMSAAKREWSFDIGALLFIVKSTSFLSSHDIPMASVIIQEDACYLRTPIVRLAQEDADHALHLQTGESFIRRIGRSFAGPLQQTLRTVSHEKIRMEEAAWLARFGCGVGQVEYALHWNSPVWRNHSWLLPEFGLSRVPLIDGRPKAPGYRSYLVWGPAVQEPRHLDLFQTHGILEKADPEVSEIERCGSRFCVKPEAATALFRALDTLLASAMDCIPADYAEMSSLLNAIAAALRLLEVLLTFRRNYPEEAPVVILHRGRFGLLQPIDLIYEKIRPRPVVYPPYLHERLSLAALIFLRAEGLLEQQGRQLIQAGAEDGRFRAYGFLSMDGTGRTIPLFGPRKTLVTSGLLHHPATEPFAKIHPNAMRDLSYYLLTSDGEFDLEAMELHDHFPDGGAGALKPHRREEIAQAELRNAAASKIVRALGLQE